LLKSGIIAGIGSARAYLSTLHERFDEKWILERTEKFNTQGNIYKKSNIEDLIKMIPTFQAALDMYTFLIKFEYPVEKVLSLPESRFVSTLHQLLEHVSYEKFPNTFILKVGQTLAEPTLTSLFSKGMKHSFLVSSLGQSARDKQLTNFLDLVKIWEILFDEEVSSDDCRRLVLSASNLPLWERAYARKVDTEQAGQALGILEWLKILGSTTFLARVLPPEDINQLADKCWSFIDSTLFSRGQNNRLESVRLLAHVENLLHGMMSLSLQLRQVKELYGKLPGNWNKSILKPLI